MLRLLHVQADSVSELDPARLDEGLPADGYFWLDLERPTEEEAAVLRHPSLAIDPLVIEDLLEDEHLPKLDVLHDELLLTVHALSLDSMASELKTHEFDLVLRDRLLVSHHVQPLVNLLHIQERMLDRGPNGADRPVLLMHLLLDTMNDVFVSFLDHMDSRIDVIEQDILSDPTETTRREIYGLQRDVIQLRRAVVPQAEVIRRLGRSPTSVVAEDDLMLFRDLHDHLYRMAEMSDSYRQLLDSALQSFRSHSDANLNRMLRTLTILNALLLPIGVIAGIYGMNFRNMPELQRQNGYFTVLAVFVFITTVQLLLFRRAGWIGNRAERNAMARRVGLPNVLEIPLFGSVLKVPVAGARVATRTVGHLLTLGRRDPAEPDRH